jgi:hypothetical protein
MAEQSKDRSKDKLNKYLEAKVKKLFTGVLDYTELTVDSEKSWQTLRSRILKLSNDTIREMKREVDTRYDVSYIPLGEDIIIVKKTK